MKKMMEWKTKKGGTLALVILVAAALMVLSTGFLAISRSENVLAARQEDKVQAYYIARSGAESVAEYLISDPGQAEALVDKTSAVNTQIGGGSFQVSVETYSANQLLVTSVGTYEGISQDVKILMTHTSSGVGGIFENAITAVSGVSMSGNGNKTVIEGSVATKEGTISLGSKGVATGGTTVDPDLIFPPIVLPPDMDPPESYDHTYNNITSDTTISSSDGAPVHVLVNGDIALGGNDELNITGDGVVHAYVMGGIDMKGTARFDVAEDAKLCIYVVNGDDVIYTGSDEDIINTLVYAPDSFVEWDSANHDFEGVIIGREEVLHNMLSITADEDLVNVVELDKTHIGVTFTGYSWVD